MIGMELQGIRIHTIDLVHYQDAAEKWLKQVSVSNDDFDTMTVLALVF